MLAIHHRDRSYSIHRVLFAGLAAALAMLLLAPAAGATSLVAQLTTEDEDERTTEAALVPSLTLDEILFLEDNWHLSDRDIALEQDSAAQAAPDFGALSRDDIQFMEDNWHFSTGDLFLVEDVEIDEVRDAAQIRDEIKFLEDNWYYSAEDVDADAEDASESHKPMSRAEMKLLEENHHLGLSEDVDSDEDSSSPVLPCCGDIGPTEY